MYIAGSVIDCALTRTVLEQPQFLIFNISSYQGIRQAFPGMALFFPFIASRLGLIGAVFDLTLMSVVSADFP
jgi:hypothetical protein